MTWPRCRSHDPGALRLQRLALAALVYVRFSALRPYSEQPFPVGIARYVDFSFLANDVVAWWLKAGLVLSLVLYVIGRAMPLAVGYMLFLWVAAGALANSQGALSHYTQLVAMVLIGQLIAYAQWWAMDRTSGRAPQGMNAHDLALYYTQQVIAAAYVLAGISKIVLSRGRWIAQVPFMASDVLKTHGQSFASTLAGGVIERGDAIAAFILAHPDLMRALLGCGLLFELAAPAALLGRTPAFLIGIGLLTMHAVIGQLMLIRFPENQVLLLIYFIDVPFLLVAAWRRLLIPTIDHARQRAGA